MIQNKEEKFKVLGAHFDAEAKKYEKLISHDHNVIGRVLKCHLIIENYIDGYLKHSFPELRFDNAQLSFSQKVQLLPDNPKTSFLKSGILELNKIRNKFGHNLNAFIQAEDIKSINEVLKVARAGAQFPGMIERIEVFTSIASTFLVAPSKEVQEIFKEIALEIQSKAEFLVRRKTDGKKGNSP